MPDVRVISCGGTIASEPTADGAAPAKAGHELVDAVPELSVYADVEAVEVASHPGFDMRWDAVFGAADAAREAAAAGVDGLVVTHGTDTLAETARALSFLLDLPIPLVVTGSQRRFDEVGSDAPANLATAVRAAAAGRYAGRVIVAFDDELHAAADVEKTHTNALSTFKSPGKGPVATYTRAGPHHSRDPPSTPTLDAAAATADVAVVTSGLGAGADAFVRALHAGGDGVVVEGTGLGNVTAELGDAIGRTGVPVVVASRCHAGPTEPVYGTPGGGVTLDRHGVLWAGDRSAAKARVALTLALSAGLADDELRAVFDDPPRPGTSDRP